MEGHPPFGRQLGTWLTLEFGEQTNHQILFGGFGFQPLNHKKSKNGQNVSQQQPREGLGLFHVASWPPRTWKEKTFTIWALSTCEADPLVHRRPHLGPPVERLE